MEGNRIARELDSNPAEVIRRLRGRRLRVHAIVSSVGVDRDGKSAYAICGPFAQRVAIIFDFADAASAAGLKKLHWSKIEGTVERTYGHDGGNVLVLGGCRVVEVGQDASLGKQILEIAEEGKQILEIAKGAGRAPR